MPSPAGLTLHATLIPYLGNKQRLSTPYRWKSSPHGARVLYGAYGTAQPRRPPPDNFKWTGKKYLTNN
ncbi:Hypothetical protein FKW44_006616 [Caligus rogercresseyi]|uniref:Uncharacterized protein n=1 Tax=Caligus rogercresseyi TaxID=217165 RepID=A0A7T8QT11_CALRO|nr:Hypothetical protein FKW44_006616 [Caligus rogercresseyi]